MVAMAFKAAIGSGISPYLTGISALTSSGGRLYAGSGAVGGMATFTLAPNTTAQLAQSLALPPTGGTRVDDLGFIGGSRLLASTSASSTIWQAPLGGGAIGTITVAPFSGATAEQTGQIAPLSQGGHDYLVTGGGQAGLTVWEYAAGGLSFRGAALENAKANLADVSDIVTVTPGAVSYVIAASVSEGGLTSLAVGADGAPQFVDAIGAKEGLFLSGLDELMAVTAGGLSYVVAGGVNSGSLALVRVNPLGVMYVTDLVSDTLGTRFAHLGDLAGFSINGRGFVLAGGTDDGLSLFEITPDGTLLHLQSIANQTGWTLTDTAALTAVSLTGEVQVFAAGSTPGLMQFSIPTGGIAAPLTGTSAANTINGGAYDDLIWGMAGNDTLRGYGGDDILSGGAGADVLTGGAGRDVFYIDASTGEDRITDFQDGQDRIALHGWGNIHDVSALTLAPLGNGARISYGDHSLLIVNAAGTSLGTGQLTNDDFLF